MPGSQTGGRNIGKFGKHGCRCQSRGKRWTTFIQVSAGLWLTPQNSQCSLLQCLNHGAPTTVPQPRCSLPQCPNHSAAYYGAPSQDAPNHDTVCTSFHSARTQIYKPLPQTAYIGTTMAYNATQHCTYEPASLFYCSNELFHSTNPLVVKPSFASVYA